MTTKIAATCPKCRKVVRFPTDWLERPIRCKSCGQFMMGLRKEATAPPAATPFVPMASGNGTNGTHAHTSGNGNGTAPPPAAAYVPGQGQTTVDYAPAAGAFVPPTTPGAPPPVASPFPSAPVGADYDTGPQGVYKPAFLPDTDTRSRRKYQGPGGSGSAVIWMLGGLCLLLVGTVAMFVMNPDLLSRSDSADQARKSTQPEAEEENLLAGPFEAGQYPRRLLSINLSNYLYANPIHTGQSYQLNPAAADTRDIHDAITWLAGQWKIPKEQAFELSDSLPEGKRLPPLKVMIDESLKRFLQTSRGQDRLVILYTGHAEMVDDEAYLVPIEGDLDEPDTLYPLKDFYAKLGNSLAQEILVIFDVARYNPDRGQERPGGGPMSPELEQALHKTAPPGVHVWTSCSADEKAYEYDFQANEQGYAIYGSVFLSSFFYASARARLGGGLDKPSASLPVEKLREAATKFTSDAIGYLVRGEDGTPQTPKFTLGVAKINVPYDNSAQPPHSFRLPDPPKGADKNEVRTMIDQIRVPPIKMQRRGEPEFRVEDIYPFPVEVMNEYRGESLTDIQILQNPDRWPIREIALRASMLLNEVREGDEDSGQLLPEEIRGELNDQRKAEFIPIQQILAVQVRLFNELNREMDGLAAEELDYEESKRWQANFMYIWAEVKARLAYLNQYNLALGKARGEQLPPLGDNQNGWRLASVAKLDGAREFRELARDASDLFSAVAEDHPDTPWMVLAKRQKSTSLGLRWVAANFGGAY